MLQVNNQCSTGSSALMLMSNMIKAGTVDIGMALGEFKIEIRFRIIGQQHVILIKLFFEEKCGYIEGWSWHFKAENKVSNGQLTQKYKSVHFHRYEYGLLMKIFLLGLYIPLNIPSKECFIIQATFLSTEFLNCCFFRKF